MSVFSVLGVFCDNHLMSMQKGPICALKATFFFKHDVMCQYTSISVEHDPTKVFFYYFLVHLYFEEALYVNPLISMQKGTVSAVKASFTFKNTTCHHTFILICTERDPTKPQN